MHTILVTQVGIVAWHIKPPPQPAMPASQVGAGLSPDHFTYDPANVPGKQRNPNPGDSVPT